MSEYLRNCVSSSVHHFARTQVGNSRRMIELARQHLPYALFLRKDARLLVLNREYKPLGWPTRNRAWVDYESPDFILLTIPAPAPLIARAAGERSMTMLYESPAPWRSAASANAYRERVAEVFGISSFAEEGDSMRDAA